MFKFSYLLEFILAEKGLADMFSSIGRLTDGIGMFEMPLSYRRLFKSFFFDLSGTKLFRSIYTREKRSFSVPGKNWVLTLSFLSWETFLGIC